VPDAPVAPEPLEIREVRPEEYAEAGRLVEAAYTAGGLLDNDRGYGAHVRDVAGRAADHVVLVALRHGRLVGSVTITPHGTPQSELARDDEVEFRYLGVAPEAWGGGVAAAMVAACQEYAVSTGARRLVICVISDNVRAHRLYERLGFVRTPDRDWTPVPGVELWAFERPVHGTV
jgi:ribosomal protein S18 acetylase RimI-like enzyme